MSLLSTSATLSDLDTRFRTKLDTLQVCADLRGGWGEDTVVELEQQAEELATLRGDIAFLRTTISEARNDLATSWALLSSMQQLSSRLTHMKNNLPDHLPHAVPHQAHASKKPVNENNDKTVATIVQEKGTAKVAHPKAKQIPMVEFVTTAEFESVSKYIRGRLQYSQVNAAVEEVNKTLKAKYALLSRPRAKLSEQNMKIVGECRRQENNETKGLHFVVDADIKRWSSLKMDASGKSLLTVLRTLKRMREVRGPGSLVRYAVLV